MDEAKEVHKCLRKAAGLFNAMQVCKFFLCGVDSSV